MRVFHFLIKNRNINFYFWLGIRRDNGWWRQWSPFAVARFHVPPPKKGIPVGRYHNCGHRKARRVLPRKEATLHASVELTKMPLRSAPRKRKNGEGKDEGTFFMDGESSWRQNGLWNSSLKGAGGAVCTLVVCGSHLSVYFILFYLLSED